MFAAAVDTAPFVIRWVGRQVTGSDWFLRRQRAARSALRIGTDTPPPPTPADTADPAIMNLCVVSEGTYEVCSHTVGINRASAGQYTQQPEPCSRARLTVLTLTALRARVTDG